jgi:hypothetical protein
MCVILPAALAQDQPGAGALAQSALQRMPRWHVARSSEEGQWPQRPGQQPQQPPPQQQQQQRRRRRRQEQQEEQQQQERWQAGQPEQKVRLAGDKEGKGDPYAALRATVLARGRLEPGLVELLKAPAPATTVALGASEALARYGALPTSSYLFCL